MTDPSAYYWNPAGLADAAPELTADYISMYGLSRHRRAPPRARSAWQGTTWAAGWLTRPEDDVLPDQLPRRRTPRLHAPRANTGFAMA